MGTPGNRGFEYGDDFLHAIRFTADAFNYFTAGFTEEGEEKPTQDGFRQYETKAMPRKGYIDGGIILSKTVVITRVDWDDMSYEEWKQLEDWAQSMPNIQVNELLENKVLHLYSITPTITSMEA